MNVEPATDDMSMQDITSRVESSLYAVDETELTDEQDEVVLDDDQTDLPEGDDTDSEEEDGSDDLEVDVPEDELSLAGYLGLDDDKLTVNDDGSVVFNAIIDGQAKEVPLKDLATSYQMQGHVNNKSIALENERKEFETQRDAIATSLEAKFAENANFAKVLEEQLVSDYNQIDWDRLRAEQPSEWSALRQEYAEKAQNIQATQAQIGQEQRKLMDERNEVRNNQHQLHLQAEMQKMVAANPTWSNPEVMKSDTDKMKAFLGESYGFSKEDFAMVTDHRLIGLIQDAQAYRNGKSAAKVKINKNVPKFQKPGAAKGNAKSLAKARGIKANRESLKKSGKTQDAARILLDRM